MSNAVVSSHWHAGPGTVLGDPVGVQRSPSSPTPLGSSGLGRSIGVGKNLCADYFRVFIDSPWHCSLYIQT